jgi:hypothetical protein
MAIWGAMATAGCRVTEEPRIGKTGMTGIGIRMIATTGGGTMVTTGGVITEIMTTGIGMTETPGGDTTGPHMAGMMVQTGGMVVVTQGTGKDL